MYLGALGAQGGMSCNGASCACGERALCAVGLPLLWRAPERFRDGYRVAVVIEEMIELCRKP